MPFSQNIPTTTRTPGAFVDFDSTGASSPTPAKPLTVLLSGIRLATGSIAALTVKEVFGVQDGDGFFGVGSQLAAMCRAYREVDPTTKLLAIGQAENGAGVAASGTFIFAGTATAAGTISIYIHGVRITAGVANGDTANTVAAAVNAAINAMTSPYLHVTSSVSTGTVTVTCRWKGTSGNDIAISKNFQDGDADVAGITNTVSAATLTGGATNPAASAVIAALGADTQYDKIAIGVYDSTAIGLWETELENRWGPMVALEGLLHVGIRGDASTTTTFTAAPARNSKQSTVMSVGLSPSTPWSVICDVAAQAASKTDPAANLSTLPLKHLIPPPAASQFSRATRQSFLTSGASTYRLDGGNNAIIDRLITTYQKDSFGTPDASFLDYNTLTKLAYVRWNVRGRIQKKYGSFKLAASDTKFGPGQAIMTPNIMTSELLAWYRDMEFAGIVQDFNGFQRDLVVSLSGSDPNRIDAILPVRLVNNFYIFAANIAFRF